jgi:hypothetical protein
MTASTRPFLTWIRSPGLWDGRQSVRESKKGFMPQSAMEAVPFGDRSFVYDMVLPRLQDMLTETEFER